MVSYGGRTSCTDAELYYYEYFSAGSGGGIPPAVIDHIGRCANCQRRIRELKCALGEGSVPVRPCHEGPEVVDTLTAHFAWIGREVGCREVRAFLPALLTPSQKVVIPTPITVHLDHCQWCAEDLDALGELHLRPGQLARLSRLYAARGGEGRAMCRRARLSIPLAASMSFEEIDSAILDHLCTCPDCRRRVYERRERIRVGESPGVDPRAILCDNVSAADLFECVAPFGRAQTEAREGPAVDNAVLAHVRACPRCTERAQALHRTVYGIAERADSGVATVYTTGAEADAAPEQAAERYQGYSIHVEVTQRKPVPARIRPAAHLQAALRRAVADPHFKPALKATLAAAAVLLLTVAFFFNTQTVSGVSIDQIIGAVKDVDTLHVTRYGTDSTKPIYELWKSADSGRVAVKYADRWTLYDLKNKRMVVRNLRRGTAEGAPLGSQEPQGVQPMVDRILASAAVEETPANAELQHLEVNDVEDFEPGCDVYDAIYSRSTLRGSIVRYRMRIFLDSVTHLPKMTQSYRWIPEEGGWVFQTTSRFEYPSPQEADRAIDDGPVAR
jgi:hypothetical protein